jgi:hypothetical protein
MRDVLMFVWVKFCCPMLIVIIRVPGFQSATEPRRGVTCFFSGTEGFYFTTLDIFLIALFFISTLDIKLLLHNPSMIDIKREQMLLKSRKLRSPCCEPPHLDSLSVPALL